jgi:hypothetical protein
VSGQQLLIAHFLAAVVMTAVIWFVQFVQYPLLAWIGPDGFAVYAAEYQRRVSWIVIPPMLVELATALGLAVWFPGVYRSPEFVIATVLLASAWLSTFLWQVPLHQKLLSGFNEETIARLVRSNWLRTFAWTARALLIGWILCRPAI